MSPNSLRVLAGTAAAVLVLLTGILVGFVARVPECEPAPKPVTPSTVASQAGQTGQADPGGTGPADGGSEGSGVKQEGQLGEPVGGSRSNPPKQQAAPPEPSAAAARTPAPVAADVRCDDGTFNATAALVAVAGAGLTVAVAVGLLLAAGLRRPAPVAAAPAAGPPPRGGADPRGALDADRAALVRACIYVRDRVTSRALADRLAAALRDAGITVVEPVGDRFDPGRHEAGGATPATDPTQVGTIAAVEVPGYTDRTGRVLRAPVVTVYQGNGSSARPGPRSATTPGPHDARRRTEEDR